jgi:orotate phosphoribosyltransferase
MPRDLRNPFHDATTRAAADPLAQEFVQFAVEAGVLRFGEFKTKAGRLSPYFFNAGLFDDGAKLGRLAEFYARRLLASGLQFDMLFGPAYKGIHAGGRGGDRAGAAGPQRAVRLQPQGGQGPRRRRHAGRRAGARAGC